MKTINKIEENLEFCEFLILKFKLENGVLYRKWSFGWRVASGTEHNKGYLTHSVAFKKKTYHLLAHRLIWMLHCGSFPKLLLDHINRDKTDNRIENLREVTNSDNMLNCYVSQKPTALSGFLGVSFKKKKFQANIVVEGKKIYLGSFVTAEEAAHARDKYITDNNLAQRYKLNFPS